MDSVVKLLYAISPVENSMMSDVIRPIDVIQADYRYFFEEYIFRSNYRSNFESNEISKLLEGADIHEILD